MNTPKIKISICPLLENVRLVGQCISVLSTANLSESDGAQFELCVVEALNNVVEHGYADEAAAAGTISMALSIEQDDMVVEIVDSGTSMPAGLLNSGREMSFDIADIDSLPEGGMGLIIIGQFMDDVSYNTDSDGNNRLVMRKSKSA